MLSKRDYVTLSLELHLFFGRIMKEHALFLEAGFTPVDADFAQRADRFKEDFQRALRDAVRLSDDVVSQAVIASGEIVTGFTLQTENKTEFFTGINIDSEITRMELCLKGSCDPRITGALLERVMELNKFVRPLLADLIDFKKHILEKVLSCRMFTLNYPLLIEHILREAMLYQSQLTALEEGCDPRENARETELFWDRIMMEHALFIRGLLDPTENELIVTSDDFAEEFAALLRKAKEATSCTIESVTDATLQETIKIRDFKAAGTNGIINCEIRSIILPLLADHVLREANHFIRLLRQLR